MDIYDYITQIKLFLERQNNIQTETISPVSADLVMRFRRATPLSVLQSKQFLAQFPPLQQIQYVEMAELQYGKELYDPIVNDPAIRPLYELICDEAKQEVELWHKQRITELEKHSTTVAGLFSNGRGLSHIYWVKVKQLLWERHQIEWRSPAEMNPWMIFD